ncbi:MAG: hypothetical protein ACXWDO_02100 [Bacteroidia bacterium]
MKTRLLLLLCIFSVTAVYAQSRTIHVLVALCDNVNQGIVPVPSKIGNGQDPANNLYWGCGYGVKTFMKKQPEWKLIKQINKPAKHIYERLIFRHKDSAVYFIADAYDGAQIKQTTIDFLDYSAGLRKEEIILNDVKIPIGGNAYLLCYIGHNGLMDFSLDKYPAKADNKMREVIILACASQNYFEEAVRKTGAYPLLWTTNLMCPEAYTLIAAVNGWVKGESRTKICESAAAAYHKYQKCGLNAARKLFATGW